MIRMSIRDYQNGVEAGANVESKDITPTVCQIKAIFWNPEFKHAFKQDLLLTKRADFDQDIQEWNDAIKNLQAKLGNTDE